MKEYILIFNENTIHLAKALMDEKGIHCREAGYPDGYFVFDEFFNSDMNKIPKNKINR